MADQERPEVILGSVADGDASKRGETPPKRQRAGPTGPVPPGRSSSSRKPAPMTHHDHHHGEPGHDHRPPSAAPVEKDPVCGMTVDPATAKHKAVHGGQTYHFCSAGCETKFKAAPERYLSEGEDPATEPAPAGAIYTCPMHPQIRQPTPGNCPICGMALEPGIATGEAGPSSELRDMTRRFWVGLGLALPVFLLEMGGHLLDLHTWLGPQTSNWIQLPWRRPWCSGPAAPSSSEAGSRS